MSAFIYLLGKEPAFSLLKDVMDLQHIDPQFTREPATSSLGCSHSTYALSASVQEAHDAFAGFFICTSNRLRVVAFVFSKTVFCLKVATLALFMCHMVCTTTTHNQYHNGTYLYNSHSYTFPHFHVTIRQFTSVPCKVI
jgi:hypothetical protein